MGNKDRLSYRGGPLLRTRSQPNKFSQMILKIMTNDYGLRFNKKLLRRLKLNNLVMSSHIVYYFEGKN